MHLKISVDSRTQQATLLADGKPLKIYPISTSAKGLGNEAGSYKTPTGLFKVSQKIGEGAEMGAVFRARQPTGERWSTTGALKDSQEDLILTRILWLEGSEAANANTKERFIYFHGTNQEELLGQPVSHGCIRMSNKDVMDLFERVPVGTEVEIG